MPARTTLVLGGARSGKSAWAERLLADHPRVTYVATGRRADDDPAWCERVAAHVARRPAGWRTLETVDVAAALRSAGADEALLVDGLGTWLTAVLDGAGAWEDRPGWATALQERSDELVDAWAATRATAVLVADEVGGGVVPASSAGRLFRDAAGTLNQAVAAVSGTAVLVVAGLPLLLRGTLPGTAG